MKLEQNDSSILFSTTEISDIFFTEYLSQANGDYIKVYLYILFLSKYGKDVRLNDLSKKLALPLKTIQDVLNVLFYAAKGKFFLAVIPDRHYFLLGEEIL